MAHASQLPCNGEGMCMQCKQTPAEEEQLCCKTCATPWHVACLARRPESLASTLQWECPDCSGGEEAGSTILSANAGGGGAGGIVAEIMAIEADASLTESEKARRRQELLSGRKTGSDGGGDGMKNDKGKDKVADGDGDDAFDICGGSLNCSFCMQLPERPVTTPCGHNFCLKCFLKWIGQGKKTCAKCRCPIPSKMASQPRINSTLVAAIRMAKKPNKPVTGGPSKIYTFVHNQDRPDKAYTTERAKKKGKANAASGKIFVTLPPDHFGPILAEHDPERNQGVLVGESWEGRLECRQWGLHYPPVAGIAGQSQYGAQSVVLSGGYEDDEDHGEWFLYTGSGGRDLSGNKRTNRSQSFDQKFLKLNEALRVSCKKGYPVRVVRSCKEKRSSYAPEKGLRYDGIYRIEECWRKIGVQGFKVCRYLFVRCDNDPAPWTSDDHGDWPRPLPEIPELVTAVDITKRKESASWDFDEVDSCWKWTKPPPLSRVVARAGKSDGKKSIPIRVKLLREFGCFICKQVMAQPVTTPCAHNFCKLCLEATFSGQCFVRERSRGGRALRSQRTIMKCPSCTNDISDFLKEPQVNRELMEVIESLKQKTEEDKEPPEELNDDEETDASEGLSDHGPASSETSETNVAAGSDKPTAKCKSGRPSKRKKVGSLGTDNDKEETSIVVEKPDGFDVDSGSGEVQAGNFEVGKKDKRAEETMEEENDSPSSPLLVLSDGQDSA